MIKTTDLIAKFQHAIDDHWGYIWGKWGQVWTQQDQNNASRESTVLYGSRWIGHHVADCSGLFRWAFKQLGYDIHHGSNLIYNSDCTRTGRLTKGERSDGVALKPGTAVFTGTAGDHGHIGLYIGNGSVIEASGTQVGVIISEAANKKWTWWGELKNVDYEGDTPVPDKKPTLRRGDSGPYVTLAQTELIQRGYDLGKYGADGKFGAKTEEAVKAFQRDWGLQIDGIIGEKTWAMLESTPVAKYYTVTVPHMSLKDAEALKALHPGATMREE